MARRPSRCRRAGVLAVVLVLTAHSQVYRSESTVLPGAMTPGLRRVLAAVSEQPGTLVLLADPEAGILTIAKVLAGIELEQAALKRSSAVAALSVNGVFLRADGHGGSEVYGHSSVLVIGPGEGRPQFLNSTGFPEAQLMAALSGPSRQATGQVRVLPMAAGAVWDALRRLEAEGVMESRVFSPELGVATVVLWDRSTVTVGTLFVEESSPTETRVKANAVVLSPPECLPAPRGKTAPETALLDRIAGGAGARTLAKPSAGSAGFCPLLAELAEFPPLYRIRGGAVEESVAAEPEAVWSALLLVVRQFAVVDAVDKARRRIQYEAPCWQDPPPEPREKRFERLLRPRPWCTVSVWLEPRQSETDVFAALSSTAPDGRHQIESLLARVAEQIFAEEKLRHLTREGPP